MPQILLNMLFWKINLIKMMKIFMCESACLKTNQEAKVEMQSQNMKSLNFRKQNLIRTSDI